MSTTGDRLAETVLATVRSVVEELHPGASAHLSLDSLLDRDLGLDSLALVELLERLERAVGVVLPDELLTDMQTPRDLLRPIARSAPHPAEPLPPTAPILQEQGGPPAGARTLTEVLDWHADNRPEALHVRLLHASGPVEEITCRDLQADARAIARGLRERGIARGDAVALMLPTSRQYFGAFLGVLVAGGVPVPIYPPWRPSQIEEQLLRQAGILENAQARLLVTVPEARPAARLLHLRVPALRRLVTPEELAAAAGPEPAWSAVSERDAALVQYTSGSTGAPKGVVLSHANLLANIRAMGEAAGVGPGDVFVSWLPLYHDMGLIGAWLASLYFGMTLVVMPPTDFLRRPARWLRAIHEHRGTVSASPNFGYELCLRRVEEEQLVGLDLSSWRIAFNGAEPVSPDTVARFTERFGPFGFQPEVMTPVYGLAEASVGLTFPPLGRGPVIDRIEREPFLRSGRALPASEDDPHPLRPVACGRALPGHDVRIVDPTGTPVGERQQGRIEFRGPSATSGYLRNPRATRRLFRDGWLDSGDLGYRAGGDLYVTGREKDVVIRAGRNLHPQELEEAVGGVEGVRKGRTAVFGAQDPTSGTERLVVLAETREPGEKERGRIRSDVVSACIDLLGTPPDDVVLAPPGTVLKTSSGKVRRAACRELYELGRVGTGRRAVWRQVVRLLASGAGMRLRRVPGAAASAL